jgi:hypothetical protein
LGDLDIDGIIILKRVSGMVSAGDEDQWGALVNTVMIFSTFFHNMRVIY